MGPETVKISARRALALVAGAGALVAAITAAFVVQDSGIAPPSDSAHHLVNAIFYARVLGEAGVAAFWATIRSQFVGWPPGTYALIYGPLGALLGDAPVQIRVYSVVLLPLLLWATYAFARRLGGRAAGALAAVLCAFSFGVSGQVRQVSIDLPAAAAASLALLALLRAAERPGLRSALWVGAALGGCLFTRVQSLFFVAGPALLVLGRSLAGTRSRAERARLAGWFAAAAAAALALSSPWWWGRADWLWSVATAHLDPQRVTPRGDPRLVPGLLFYARALGQIAGWPVLLAALAALAALPGVWRRRRSTGEAILWLAVAGGLLGCSLGVHREARYLLPAVPPLAVLAALAVFRLAPRPREPAGAALILLVVGPTLWCAAFPPTPDHTVIRREVLEWAYVRPPLRAPSPAVAASAVAAIRRAQPGAADGARTYVILAPDNKHNLLPRVTAYLTGHFPRMLFGNVANVQQVNLRWQHRARRQRKVFVLSALEHELNLPLVWAMNVRERHARLSLPLRLYLLPDSHPLRGHVRRDQLVVKKR